MSYTIVYNTVFLKSNEMIVPCVLAGDNNVWEYTHRGRSNPQRRVRDWSVIGPKATYTVEEFEAIVNEWAQSETNEHWVTKNKWVDNEGLIRWYKSYLRKAITLEDFCSYNGLYSIHCFISKFQQHNQLDKYIKTNEEFAEWLSKANQFVEQEKGNGWFVIIDFGKEDVKVPSTNFKYDDLVVMKKEGMYLSSVDIEKCYSDWNVNESKALVLTYAEAISLKRKCLNASIMNQARIIKAKTTQKHRSKAIIAVVRNGQENQYVFQVTPLCVRFTDYKEKARVYATLNSAKKTANKINRNCSFLNGLATAITI